MRSHREPARSEMGMIQKIKKNRSFPRDRAKALGKPREQMLFK